MDPWSIQKLEAYEAYEAERMVHVNDPMTRLEHRAFFRNKLREGDLRWLEDYRNAKHFDENTAVAARQVDRLLAKGNCEQAGMWAIAAMDAAADWYYEENQGQPF